MKRSELLLDAQKTRITKDLYRPSSNIIRFVKSVVCIVVNGHSPITQSAYMRRK